MQKWVISQPRIYEAGSLKLDSSLTRQQLGWYPGLRLPTVLEWLIEWYKAHTAGANVQKLALQQIALYEALGRSTADG